MKYVSLGQSNYQTTFWPLTELDGRPCMNTHTRIGVWMCLLHIVDGIFCMLWVYFFSSSAARWVWLMLSRGQGSSAVRTKPPLLAWQSCSNPSPSTRTPIYWFCSPFKDLTAPAQPFSLLVLMHMCPVWHSLGACQERTLLWLFNQTTGIREYGGEGKGGRWGARDGGGLDIGVGGGYAVDELYASEQLHLILSVSYFHDSLKQLK